MGLCVVCGLDGVADQWLATCGVMTALRMRAWMRYRMQWLGSADSEFVWNFCAVVQYCNFAREHVCFLCTVHMDAPYGGRDSKGLIYTGPM